MELFELSAKLKLDDSSFNKGINAATSAGEMLGQRMSAVTVAVGQIAADVIRKAASAISGVVQGAMGGYAEYQQLIGGVETLFKESAGKVANYAKQSFKTTGLSANDYMETVTSFSASLMQGLQGNTEAAADIANIAVIDMSDNANKMGTNMQSIQNAYQGFAKQNYTMLDNLKLGYGGTKQEMLRLVNDSGILSEKVESLDDITFDQLILAIHAIQQQLGITGTTAEEAAETISGSRASVTAAWSDFLSAVGGEGGEKRLKETSENFKQAFTTYITNQLPTLITTISNSDVLVDTFADAITSIPTKAFAQIANGGFELIGSGFDALSQISGWVIDGIVGMLQEITINPSHLASMGESIGQFFGTTFVKLITSLPDVVGGLVSAGITLAGSLINGLIQGLTGDAGGLGEAFSEADRELSNGIREATRAATEGEGILTYMQGLVDKYGDAAKGTQEWQSALDQLEQVMPGATEYINKHSGSLQSIIENLAKTTDLPDGAKEILAHLGELAGKYGDAARNTDDWKNSMAELEKVMPGATEKIDTQNQSLSTTISNLKEEIQQLKNKAIEEAKQKALQTKRDAYYAAVTELGAQQGALEYNQSVYDTAAKHLIDIIRQYDPTAKQFTDQQFKDLGAQALAETASTVLESYSGLDWDSDEYKALSDSIAGDAAALTDAENQINQINGTIQSLQDQVDKASAMLAIAEEAQNRASTQTSTMADAAAAATMNLQALAAVKIPSWNSGDGKSAGRGNETWTPNATGLDWVPYNGYRAELHRGEAVLTAAQNQAYRNGGLDYNAMGYLIGDAVETAMGRVGVYLSGNKVADMTSKRTGRNINATTNARLRALGG